MKKAVPILLAVLLACSLFTACAAKTDDTNVPQSTAAPAVQERITAAAPEPGKEELPKETTAQEEIQSVTEQASQTVTSAVPEMGEDSTFDIFFLDVGQGDAACVICDGEAMMIDGGPGSRSDMIYSFLKTHSLDHLNCIIATHRDEDHVGGLAGALNYATVDDAYCTTDQSDSEAFDDFLKYLGKQNKEITIPEPGEVFYLGCAKVTFLYPEAGKIQSENTSVTVRIEYGETSFLFTGDCETPDEKAMLLSGYELKSDVLKVAHHGSRDATGEAFLRSVDPEFAVIPVGGDNTYGHPTQEVLTRLENAGVTVFRTDIHGQIHCTSDGQQIRFDVEKNAGFDAFLAAGGYLNYLEAQKAQQEERTTAQEEQEPEPEQENTTAGVDYVVNINSDKFHYPSCPSVKQMSERNKWYYTGTRDELIEMGFDPCKRCNP